LSPRGVGSTLVEVASPSGGSPAIAEVHVRAAVGTFGIDLFLKQPAPIGAEAVIVKAADWWSSVLDGNEWPDRAPGCPESDNRPFENEVKATADELLIGIRIENNDSIFRHARGFFDGCFLPDVAEGMPVLRPGGGWVVASPGAAETRDVYLHEIGHALGLVLWGPESGLMTPDRKHFTGPRAVEAYRAIQAWRNDSIDPAGVPLHDDGSHWALEVNDYMSIIARAFDWISLAALADGGYSVDMSKATLPPGMPVPAWSTG